MQTTNSGENPVIEFTAEAVSPLSLFVAKHDIRFYLHGLFVAPAPNGKGCVIVGCDGHRMAMWYDASGQCSQEKVFKITPEFVSACKKRSKNALPRRVKLEDGRLVVFDGFNSEIFIQAGKAEIEDCKYPNVFGVIPKKLVPGLRGYVNSDYIKQIGKAGQLFGIKHSGVSFYSADEKGIGASVAVFDGTDNFIIVTMPRRGRDEFPSDNPLKSHFILEEKDVSAKATANFPCGSMGEMI